MKMLLSILSLMTVLIHESAFTEEFEGKVDWDLEKTSNLGLRLPDSVKADLILLRESDRKKFRYLESLPDERLGKGRRLALDVYRRSTEAFNRVPEEEKVVLEKILRRVKSRSIFIKIRDDLERGVNVVALRFTNAPQVPIRNFVASGELEGITDEFEGLSHLRALHFVNIRKSKLKFESLSGLRHLKIFTPPMDVTDADLREMSNLSSIVWLDLGGAYNVDGSFLAKKRERFEFKFINLEMSGFTSKYAHDLIGIPKLVSIVATNPYLGNYRIDAPRLKMVVDSGKAKNLFSTDSEILRLRNGEIFEQKGYRSTNLDEKGAL